MSIEIMSLAWKTKVSSVCAKMVLLKLADNANDKGIAWPSMATLAEACQLSEQGVRNQIKELSHEGHVQIQVGGGRKSNTYQLFPTLFKAALPPKDVEGSTTLRGAPDAGQHSTRLTPATKAVWGSTQEAVGGNSNRTTIEPPLNQKKQDDVLRFVDLFATRHLETHGHRIANYPDAKTRKQIAQVLALGYTPELLLDIAVAAWTHAKSGGRDTFWCAKASSIKSFINSVDNIVAELHKGKPQQQTEAVGSLAAEFNS